MGCSQLKTTIISILFFLGWSLLHAQYTLIPDVEFESRLIEQGIDTEGLMDGQVLTDDIDHIVVLNIVSQFPETEPLIQDLTGIEGFTSLENLNFASNEVTQVDLSQNLNLKQLVAKFNNLISLDVSNNLLLENLDVANCPSGTCDQENVFSSLDISNNLNLNSLTIGYNDFILEIDLSNNLSFNRGSIVGCPMLNMININNGNNDSLFPFVVLDNVNLSCITVDDPVAATAGITFPYDQWNIQNGIVFSEDCSLGFSEQVLESMVSLFPTAVDEMLFIETKDEVVLSNVKIYDSLGRLILNHRGNIDRIDVSSLQKGFYLVELQTNKGILVKKIFKE